jgi:hypothetical protein
MLLRSVARRGALAASLALLCAPYAYATRVYIDFGDGNFDTSGNLFALADSHDVDVDPNLSVGPIALGFNLDFGNGTIYNSLFLNENGIVSFGSALAGSSFTPVASLADLGVPVIAPFYSDLVGAPTDGDDSNIVLGQVFYSLGAADPFLNSAGEYTESEAVAAFRATWFGVASASDPSAHIYTQLYLYAAGGNDFDMRLSYGNPDIAGGSTTPALDALAGVALGSATASVPAPFSLTTDYIFSFRGGKLVGTTTPPTSVPEPSTTLLSVAGLALVGMICSRRRLRAALRA